MNSKTHISETFGYRFDFHESGESALETPLAPTEKSGPFASCSHKKWVNLGIYQV
jgi:hypothetical protein